MSERPDDSKSEVLKELREIKNELSDISQNTFNSSNDAALGMLNVNVDGLNDSIEDLGRNVNTLNEISQRILNSSRNLERLTFILIVMTIWLIVVGLLSLNSGFGTGYLEILFVLAIVAIAGCGIYLTIHYVRHA